MVLERLRRRPLLTYFVLAFALTWIFWIPMAIFRDPQNPMAIYRDPGSIWFYVRG